VWIRPAASWSAIASISTSHRPSSWGCLASGSEPVDMPRRSRGRGWRFLMRTSLTFETSPVRSSPLLEPRELVPGDEGGPWGRGRGASGRRSDAIRGVPAPRARSSSAASRRSTSASPSSGGQGRPTRRGFGNPSRADLSGQSSQVRRSCEPGPDLSGGTSLEPPPCEISPDTSASAPPAEGRL
jgi:hypothetical protein